MNIIYNNFSKGVLQGIIQPENEVFKIALFNSSYEPSSEHDKYENIIGYEISAEGYEKGGKYISVNKIGQDSNYVRYNCSSLITWTSTSLSCRYAIIYKEDSGMLAACYDLGDVNLSPSDNSLTLDWTASYVFSFSLTTNANVNINKIVETVKYNIINDKENEVQKDVHEYIKENSDLELDSESNNTIQNSAIINSISEMTEAAIDDLFN